MKLDSALSKISALDGVKAALVFDQTQAIVARDVPEQYSNDVLKHIATQLYQLSQQSKRAGTSTREFRLIYERYAIYMRRFSQHFYLVVFMDKGMEPSDFRQPLNLAVLVLEKALRNIEAPETTNALSQKATFAEDYLREKNEKDETFAGQFRQLCDSLLGQTGRDLVDLVVEEEVLLLPLKQEADMQLLRSKALEHVLHPLKKQILEKESEELLKKTLLMMMR